MLVSRLAAHAVAAVLALPLGAAAAELTRVADADIATAVALRDEAMRHSEAYIILESLTTEVGPRLAGSEGDARAVAWAQDKFTFLRFDKVYTEPVTFPVWRRGVERAEILEPFAHQLTLTALGSSVGTGRKPIEAQVIEFATLEALQNARADDVRGKIVFIGNRMQRAKDGAGYGPAVAARTQGAFVAAKLGARALLIRSIGTDGTPLPHTGVGVNRNALLAEPGADQRYPKTRSGMPIVATPIPAAALSNTDADLLSRVLERSRPVRVRLTLDVGFAGEYTSANVVGEFTGSERPDEVVLLGAHLDSWDMGTGAIDDGAGVSTTTAAAYLIHRMAPKHKRTLRVVAFANEESGIYGGDAYAKVHASQVDKIVLGMELDFGAGPIWRLDSGVKPEALGAIDQMMQVLAPIGVIRGDSAASGGPDIGPMRRAGMAAVDLLQDGTDYFDYHHTENDTLDKVDPKNLNQNVAVLSVVAYLAAQAEGDFGSAPVAAPASTAPAR
jgi:hypothetical protein